MAEWIRVDDEDGERWHRLATSALEGMLRTECGMEVPARDATDRRPEAPVAYLEHQNCRDGAAQ